MALQINKSGTSRFLASMNHGCLEYDVFLSFRGKDTRNNFTGLFHYILGLHGIRAFFDEEDLPKGERINEILGAIRKSKILVPIFSQRYAESKWCLREVAKMVECDDGGQERLIIPIFFDVDPTHVRHQTGPFEAAFKKHHQKEKTEEVDGWRRALGYVGGISGYHLKGQYKRNQGQLVDSIIEEIQQVLTTKRLLHEEEYLVGVDVRVDEINNRLDFEAKGARIIGIHGIGGIGKTTLAKAIYNGNRHRFQASCFIENVREVSKSSKGLVQLQQQLVQDISKDKHKKEIHNSSQGAKMIEDMVRGKSVLLVLDDVDDQKQLDALAGHISRFYSGSRVIVTTRQKKILEGLQDEAVYSLKELGEKEALQLFNHHAFGADGPQEKYNDLIEEVVSISNRLPLALQVFGALFKTATTPEHWKKLLKELRRRQLSEVHEKLRICYDSLNDEEKLIFLDIACLLVGTKSEEAIYVWEDLKLSPHLTLLSLQNKSLIKINKGKFEMHDQIRDMGREVVLRESPLHPEKRSRLWHTRDIMEALTKSQGNMTEGIILNVHEGSSTKLSTQAFELLSELRILHINYAIFGACDFKHFPACLKWLEWKGCPLETLPLESKFESIVVLSLSGSSISQLWSETTRLGSKSVKELFGGLKVLDLSSCHCLIATPNFAMAPNLEKLILDQCIGLKEVDDSIGYLKKLVLLSMKECVSLEKLPNKIYELSSLQVFNLEGCRGLVAFPQILEDWKSVIELHPDGTRPTLFPSSTSRILYIIQTPNIDDTNSTIDLSSPEGLILRDCGRLNFLPDHPNRFPSLRSVHIDDCLEDMSFRVWDIEAAYISGSPTLPQKQEFSFVLPVGSISDPLLVQQLRCHGYGDPSLNGPMVLTVHRKEWTNERWIALDTHEAHFVDSIDKDDVYGLCCTINFGTNDKINEVPRGETTIMKVTTSNNCKLTKVDVKLQNRSKFSGENMKPFISISRREASRGPPTSLPPSSSRRSELQVSIFFNHSEKEDKLDVIEYSTGIHNCIDQIMKQLNVQYDESMLFFGWTIKELIIIFTLILSDINVLWYELGHGTGLLRPGSLELFDGLKVLDLSSCHCLIATPNFAMAPNVEKLILDQCSGLKEVDDSIGYLKKLVFLSMRECVSLKKLPKKIYELSSLQVFNLEGCRALVALPQILEDSNSVIQLDPDGTSTSRILYIYQTPHIDVTNSTIDLSNQEGLILRDCGSLKFLPYHPRMFPSLRCLHIDGCLQDMAFRVWDIEAAYISASPTLPQKQEYSFLLPVGSISDPLLLQELRCHGYGDPSLNGPMVLTVHHKQSINDGWIAVDTHEAHFVDSIDKDDVYGHCYTINFGSNDKINEVPRGQTIIMKVTASKNCKLTKVDVKLQKRSKFSGENMKPFISISRREASRGPPPSLPPSSSRSSELQFSIFFNHSEEEDKLDVIEYSTGIDNCIDQIMKQLNVQCDESMLLFGWTIKELIIFTLIFSDINVLWYELGRGTGLLRPANLEVLDKIKILDFSYCMFLMNKTHDFAWSPYLEKLVLDHCEYLLEIDESIGQLKNLIQLSIVGCTKLRALPCGILQLNSLILLNIEKCPKIKMLPEASMMDVSMDALEVLILDECTSLTEIPDYVGGFRSLRHLSLRSCRLLEKLPVSIGRLEALAKFILDGCISLIELSNHVEPRWSLRFLSMKGCSSLKKLPNSIGSLEVLEELILDGCTSLTGIPDYVGGFRSLHYLSLRNCRLLKQLPVSIVRLEALEKLILDGCTSLIGLSNHVKPRWSLRLLSMKDCSSLKQLPDSIGSLEVLEELILDGCTSLTGIPDYVGGMRSLRHLSLRNCCLLEQLPIFVGRLTALEELNVAGCSSLVIVPGLETLIPLKVLHMCGCLRLDLKRFRSQLEMAEFQDLEAFNVSASIGTRRGGTDVEAFKVTRGWDIEPYVDPAGVSRLYGPWEFDHDVRISFPIGRRRSSNPLLLEKIDVLGRTDINWQPSHVRCEIEVALQKDDKEFDHGPYYVDAFVSSTDSTSHWKLPLEYCAHSASIGEDDEYCVYSARIGEDDGINERLRTLAATITDPASRVGTLTVSCSERNFSAKAFDVHMVSGNCRRRSRGGRGSLEHRIGG